MFALLAVDGAEFVAIRAALACRPFVDGKEGEKAGRAGDDVEYGPCDLRSEGKVVATCDPRTDGHDDKSRYGETDQQKARWEELLLNGWKAQDEFMGAHAGAVKNPRRILEECLSSDES